MKLLLNADHDLVFDAEMRSPPFERITIKAGSEASRTATKSNGKEYVDRKEAKREALVREGVLVPHLRNPQRLIFTRDHEFETQGAAAEVLLGHNKSARTAWQDVSSGKSLYNLYGPRR